jgi:hypothetical protein
VVGISRSTGGGNYQGQVVGISRSIGGGNYQGQVVGEIIKVKWWGYQGQLVGEIIKVKWWGYLGQVVGISRPSGGDIKVRGRGLEVKVKKSGGGCVPSPTPSTDIKSVQPKGESLVLSK